MIFILKNKGEELQIGILSSFITAAFQLTNWWNLGGGHRIRIWLSI